MPRNSQRSMNTAKSKGPLPNALRFISSLIFLYVVFGGSAWSLGAAGSLWLPILFSIAVLSSIGLFLSSLAGLATKHCPQWVGNKLVILASFALVALTAGAGSFTMPFWIVVLGFIIGLIGSAADMM